ncbi:hypothetical protein ASG52_14280 [Methylobacterium sp. Leaf456]|uniref:DUF2937 family protein n=1 Tax=Methylobacterium sp. Leaf456 TaxID=1736382 RepID=UPI0006F4B9AD|nr:DUF2937 family protein [Methylobacterium sp. Leaf456]KQT45337.1 hypothetical protein ASG52_14280 [Methylobacterium sp. Leaf456]
MFRVVRTLGLAFGLLVAALTAQGPEFAQQYAQRLGGALDELRRSIATLDADAQATGNSREQALERLRQNPDAFAARRGAAARADIERLKTLEAQKQALDTAPSPLGRLFVIAKEPDLGIARAAYRDYRPAVPTTVDGVVAGLLGFLAAWAGWRVTADFGRHMARRTRRRRVETTPV